MVHVECGIDITGCMMAFDNIKDLKSMYINTDLYFDVHKGLSNIKVCVNWLHYILRYLFEKVSRCLSVCLLDLI